MSGDRLEKALQAMKSEEATAEQLTEARGRVWEKLGNPPLCSEFQAQFRDYLDGRLAGARRLLVEDHLSRCPVCRAQFSEEKGEHKVVLMPRRRASWWPKWGAWAAAAGLALMALYAGRDSIDTLLAPLAPSATVALLRGELSLIPAGMLQPGSPIGENAVIRTGPGARAVLRLHDGSLVDINERTELSVHSAWSGQSIRLQGGDIIIRAAKQRWGHLRVESQDSVASVRGTIFAVSAGFSGTLVSVVEGSVAVTQRDAEVLLKPGQQAASNPALVSSVRNAVAWSPDAKTYLAILGSLASIEKQMAGVSSPLLVRQSFLLPYMPAGMIVYGAVPNLNGTINQAVALAEQQSTENPAFNQWWNSGAGGELKKLIGQIQTVSPLLGDEIVYGLSMNRSEALKGIPILLAEVRKGKRAELETALNSLGLQTNGSLSYQLSDALMTASNSAANLHWVLGHMRQGARSPFAQEIAARYQDGIAWLLGIDMASILSTTGPAQGQFPSAQPIKHFFVEQRKPQGVEEYELTVSFKGPRTGLASILASTGSGSAAEYLPNDSIIAVYASTRQPQQLFEGITDQFSQLLPMFRNNIADPESRIGISFSNDLIRAIGTESAFAIEGISTTGPVWTLALLVNDSSMLDATIRKLANSINGEFEREGKAERVMIEEEAIDGRTWMTMKISDRPFAVAWAYDRGYLVAASDRGTAARAIATRNGGSPLVWSPAFRQQLSAAAGLHPSGFAWLNTLGTLSSFASLVPNPVIRKLIAENDPVLVTFSGTTEQIRVVSRTRLSGMVMNLLLLGSARAGSEPARMQTSSRQ